MFERIREDYEVHLPFSFILVPEGPLLTRWRARLSRFVNVIFVQSWLPLLLYRVRMQLRRGGFPLLPLLCDWASRALWKVQIGNQVKIGPGLLIAHGNVVIDGRVHIGRGCQINPWVTIGLTNSQRVGFDLQGPTLGDNVYVGTGAKILGPITIGDNVRVGANAVVLEDVPANATVVGIPARVVRIAQPRWEAAETEASVSPGSR